MESKDKSGNRSIGEMEVENVTFNDGGMEVYMDITRVSEELQAKINKFIEKTKKEEAQEWSNKPVVILFQYLKVVLNEGEPNAYCIISAFEDAEDDRLEENARTEIDLSEYENEIKEMVCQALAEKYF